MRPAAIALVTGALATSFLHAQDAPVFRTGTTLVEVSVVAVDGDGNPVRDLKHEELALFEKGARRDIAFFRSDAIGLASRKPIELPPGVFTNRPEIAANAPTGVTAIVLDSVNSRPWDQSYARDQILRYLSQIPDGTHVGFYQAGWGIRVLHEYTNDLGVLRAKVAALIADAAAHAVVPAEVLKSSETMTPEARSMLATALEDMRRADEAYAETVDDRKRSVTLSSLETIGNHIAGVPGRKTLVWLTLGVPITTSYQGAFRNHEPQIRAVAQRLASQGISIYPVDIQGLVPPMMGISGDSINYVSPQAAAVARIGRMKATGLINQQAWSTLTIMSEVTGGRFMRNTNDMASGLRQTAIDQEGAYVIGFYADTNAPGWRPLEFRTTRRGVRLTYRQGYSIEAPFAEVAQWTDERWQSAFLQPVGSTAVRLDARFEAVIGAERGIYGLALQIPGDDLFFRTVNGRQVAEVEIAIAEHTRGGAFSYRRVPMTYALDAAMRPGDVAVRYREQWKVREDAVSVRLIVRDKYTGRYGTLDLRVGSVGPLVAPRDY